MFPALLVATVIILAYANGANANFKGVASLYGCGATGFKTAVYWAAVTTVAGSVASLFCMGALWNTFSGRGLVPEFLVANPVFLLAAAMGAMLTCGLATWLGFPISTTHALTGGLLGAGLAAEAAQMN